MANQNSMEGESQLLLRSILDELRTMNRSIQRQDERIEVLARASNDLHKTERELVCEII